MKKDYSREKLLSFNLEKQFKCLYELARFIELNNVDIQTTHFQKLQKYHHYLAVSENERMQKLHKEFHKIKALDYQFQIYLMLLERFVGQSLKEYEFLIDTGDKLGDSRSFPVICVLDSVRSAHNVGSFIRNAECFGCNEIILTGLTPLADHPQVIKTSMGSKVKWSYGKTIEPVIEKYRDQGYEIVAIETGKRATELADYAPKGPVLLIFGHEQFGISLEGLKASDLMVKVSLYGQKNSLNVAVCQAIVLNHIVSKLQGD